MSYMGLLISSDKQWTSSEQKENGGLTSDCDQSLGGIQGL